MHKLSPFAGPTVTALLLAVAVAASAQTTLAPPADRITDPAIRADHRAYEAMQSRIRALNDGGRPLADHHLAKAQCWLDTSWHEYSRNDRGPWPQAALDEAASLVRRMEARDPALPMDTPLVAGAERIRPDLWQRATALRSHSGWRCAQARAACAEVELVHAGHEQGQLGWRHAKPYVQIAEDLVDAAEAQARSCAAPPPPPVVALAPAPPLAEPVRPAAPPVAAPPPAAPRERAEVQIVAQVVFRFDRSGRADIAAGGLQALRAAVARLAEESLELQQVRVVGHADRLNGTGVADYNLRLSERRALTVREQLLALGIAAERIDIAALGDRLPREACEGLAPASPALKECLLPNRRVEVRIVARRR